MPNFIKPDAINRHPLTATPDTCVANAIALMSQTNNDVVIVTSPNNTTPIGYFTAQDVLHLVATGVNYLNLPLAAVMTTPVVTVTEAAAVDIFAVMGQIQQQQLRLLGVITATGELVGIITPTTLLQVLQSQPLCQSLQTLQHRCDEQIRELSQLNTQLQEQISNRQLVETMLSTAELKMRTTFEAMDDIVMVVHLDGNQIGNLEILPMNINIWYEANADFMTEMVEQFLQANSAHPWYNQVRQVLDTQQRQNFEYSLCCGQRQVWFTAYISPLSDNTVLWVARDTTERQQMEAALRDSEALYRTVVQQSAEGIYLADALTRRFIEANSAYLNLLGYTRAELLELTLNDIVAIAPQILEARIQTICQGTPLRVQEVQHRRKDGSYVDVSISTSLISYKGRDVFCVVVQDIRERKRAYQELEAKQHLLQTIMQANPNVIYIYDYAAQRHIYSNQQSYETLGYTSLDLQQMGTTVMQTLMHPDDFAAITVHWQKIATAKDGEVFEFEYRMRHKDGDWCWFRSRDTVFTRDCDGQPQQILGTANDITQRKQAEIALQESQRFIAAMAEANPHIFYVYDLKLDRNIYCNREITESLGYTAAEVQAMGVGFLATVMHPDDFIQVPQHLQRLDNTQAGEIIELEYRMRHKNGEWVWMQGRETAFARDCDGKLLQVLGTATDITARKRAELALQASEAELQSIFTAMSDVIVVINAEGRYLKIPPANPQLLYKPADLLIGRTVDEIFPPEQADVFLGCVCQTLATQQTQELDYQLTINGIDIWFSARVSPLSADTVIWVARDITEREMALRQWQAALQEREQAELALRDSEERFRTIFEQAAVGITLVAIAGQFLRVNQRFCDIVGYTEAELLPLYVSDITYAEDLQLDLGYREQMLAGEISTYSIEKRLIRSDGELQWVNLTVSLMRNSQGTVDYAIGIVEDISERKQAETALQESQRFISAIAQANPNILYVYDLIQHGNIYANRQIYHVLGYTDAEVAQLGEAVVQNLMHPDDFAALGEHFQKFETAQDEEIITFEYRMRHKNGEWCWFFSREKVFTRTKDGKPQQIIGAANDVTARKQAEAALRQSEERWHLALKGNKDGIWDYNLKNNQHFFSPRCREMLGYDDDELNNSQEWANQIHPQDVDGVLAAFSAHLNQETPDYVCEYRMRCKDGSYKWIQSRGQAVWDSEGKPVRAVGSITDISDRKLAEAALRESETRERQKARELELTVAELTNTQAHLIQAEKMSSLGQMVAGVAHEINNPTSFIYGNIKPATEYAEDLLSLINLYQQYYPEPVAEIAQKLRNIDLDFIADDFPKLLTSMRDGAIRITQIVHSLKNFSRLDRGETKRVDIHEGIDSTLLILQHRLKQQPQRPEINIVKEYGQLPAVECYPGQLNQVFMNLLSNAIDALEESCVSSQFSVDDPEIRITTNVGESTVNISIADNGLGIPEEVRSRIFDPFFTTKPPGKGTGLGLSISYKIIVEAHAGQMQCLSTPRGGTEFIIQLPTMQMLSAEC